MQDLTDTFYTAIICQNCGKQHIARRSDAKYCSGVCRRKAWRRNNAPVYNPTCPVCNRPFTTYRSDTLYCSSTCRHHAWRNRQGIPHYSLLAYEHRKVKTPSRNHVTKPALYLKNPDYDRY